MDGFDIDSFISDGAETPTSGKRPRRAPRSSGNGDLSAHAESIRRAAERLGVDPVDLGSIISFESAGTFDPHKAGGEGNRYRGLIQFGEPEQRKYYRPGQSFDEQVNDGVVRYFEDRFKKAGKSTRGATLEDLYTTVIAGNPNANRNARDSFGTSARSGTQKILNEHRPKVIQRIFGGQVPANKAAAFDVDSFVGDDSTKAAADFDIDAFIGATDSPTAANTREAGQIPATNSLLDSNGNAAASTLQPQIPTSRTPSTGLESFPLVENIKDEAGRSLQSARMLLVPAAPTLGGKVVPLKPRQKAQREPQVSVSVGDLTPAQADFPNAGNNITNNQQNPTIARKDLPNAGFIQEPLVDIRGVPRENLEEHLFRKSLEAIAPGFGFSPAEIEAEIADRRARGQRFLGDNLDEALADARNIKEGKIPVAVEGGTIADILNRRKQDEEVAARERVRQQVLAETNAENQQRKTSQAVAEVAGDPANHNPFTPEQLEAEVERRLEQERAKSGGSFLNAERLRNEARQMGGIEYAVNLANAGVQGAAESFAAIPDMTAIAQTAVERGVLGRDTNAKDTLAGQTSQAMRDSFERGFKVHSGLKDDALVTLSRTFGQAVPSLVMGGIGGAANLGARGAQVFAGAFEGSQLASESYRTAIRNGATENQALVTALIAAPIGAAVGGLSERLIFDQLAGLRHLDGLTRGQFTPTFIQSLKEGAARHGKNAAKGGGVEYFEESVQNTVSKLAAAGVYEKEPLTAEKVGRIVGESLKESLPAIVVGGTLSTAAGLAAPSEEIVNNEETTSRSSEVVGAGESEAQQGVQRPPVSVGVPSGRENAPETQVAQEIVEPVFTGTKGDFTASEAAEKLAKKRETAPQSGVKFLQTEFGLTSAEAKNVLSEIEQPNDTQISPEPSNTSPEVRGEIVEPAPPIAEAVAAESIAAETIADETPRVVEHPNPEINGKPVLATTADAKVVVANPANKSGVSVVRASTRADVLPTLKPKADLLSNKETEQTSAVEPETASETALLANDDQISEVAPPVTFRDLGLDHYFDGKRLKVYDGKSLGKQFVVTEKGHGTVAQFPTAAEVVNYARENDVTPQTENFQDAEIEQAAPQDVYNEPSDVQADSANASNDAPLIENADVQAPAPTEQPKPRKKPANQVANPERDTLFEFVAKSGGLRPSSGGIDLSPLESGKTKTPRTKKGNPRYDRNGRRIESKPTYLKSGIRPVVNQNGMNAEDMFREAIDAGYLSGTDAGIAGAGGDASFTVNDFIEAIAESYRDRNHYSAQNTAIAELEAMPPITEAEMDLLTKEALLQQNETAKELLDKVEREGELTDEELEQFRQLAQDFGLPVEVADSALRTSLEFYEARRTFENDSETIAVLEKSESTTFGEEVIDESEPEGDVDTSFDFADEETPKPSAAAQTFGTDLFGNALEPTEQTDLFGKSEVANLKNSTTGAERRELEGAYGADTARYITQLQQNPDKDVSRVARDLSDARKLVSAKGDEARQIVEAAADALDVFVTARGQKGNVDEIINQPRLDAKAVSDEAAAFARQMENGIFAGKFRAALSDAKTELTPQQRKFDDVRQRIESKGGEIVGTETLPSGAVRVKWRTANDIKRNFSPREFDIFEDGESSLGAGLKSNNTILKKARTPELQSELDNLRGRETMELAPQIADIEQTGDRVSLNPAGAEIIRQAVAQFEYEDSAGKKLASVPIIEGSFLDDFQLPEIVQILRNTADTAESADFGYSSEETRGLRDLADAIEQAGIESGNGTAIVGVFDDAILHESLHAASFAGATPNALGARIVSERHRDLTPFQEWADFGKAKKALARHGYKDISDATAVEEIFAHLMSGDRARLRLSEDSAADFLMRWFRSYADTHGIDSFEAFEKRAEQFGSEQQTVLDYLQRTRNNETQRQTNSAAQTEVGDATENIGDSGLRPRGDTRGAGNETIPQTPRQSGSAKGSDAATSQGSGKQKERATVANAIRRGQISDDLTPDDVKFYTPESRDAAHERALQRIEEIGLDAAFTESLQTGQNPSADEAALMMATVDALTERAMQSAERGDDTAADRYSRQVQDIFNNVAPENTKIGQFLSQQARWSLLNPETTIQYVEKQRARAGYTDPLSAEERKQIKEQAERLAESERKIRKLQAKIRRLQDLLDERPPRLRTRKASPALLAEIADARAEILAQLKNHNPREILKMIRGNVSDMPRTILREDEFGKQIVWENDEYLVAINDADSVTFISLWSKGNNKKVGELHLGTGRNRATKDYAVVRNIEIDKAHRNKGLAKELYKVALRFADEKFKGIGGENEQRINQKQIPRVYQSLGGRELEDGSFVIDRESSEILKKTGDTPLSAEELASAIANYGKLLVDAGEARGEKELTARLKADFDLTDEGARKAAVNAYKLYSEAKAAEKAAREQAKDELPDADKDLLNARAERRKAHLAFMRQVNQLTAPPLTRTQTAIKIFKEATAIPKSLLSSFDLSAPLRQGAILTLTENRIAARAFWKQLQSLKQSKHEQFVAELEHHPAYDLAQEHGLYLANAANDQSINAREEAFMSRLLGDEPVFENRIGEKVRRAATLHVRASERAYTTYLDSIRINAFQKFADEIREFNTRKNPDVEINETEQLTAIAHFINNATGRGKLYFLEDAAPVLNAVFFSPRYLSSRLTLINPATYALLPRGARKVAMRKVARFAATTGLAMGLLTLAGASFDWEEEEKGDWLKIRFGDYRYDLGAGFIQQMRFLARMVKSIRAQDGKASDIAKTFFRSKLAPTPGAIWNVAEGKNMVGEPATPLSEAQKLVFPLISQDFGKAIRDEGGLGFAKMLPAVFGIGVQAYKDKEKKAATAKKDAADDVRKGQKSIKDLRQELNAKVKAGEITAKQAANTLRQAGMTELEAKISTGKIADDIKAVREMSFDEKAEVLTRFRQRVFSPNSSATPAQRAEVRDIIRQFEEEKKKTSGAFSGQRFADVEFEPGTAGAARAKAEEISHNLSEEEQIRFLNILEQLKRETPSSEAREELDDILKEHENHQEFHRDLKKWLRHSKPSENVEDIRPGKETTVQKLKRELYEYFFHPSAPTKAQKKIEEEKKKR